MERNRSLDGLRAVAVLMVLLLHHNFLNMGWMGVDVFFALSGFLITSILRRTRNDAHYWREFWMKRATRILPPLLLVILAVRLFGPPSTALQWWGYLLSFGDYLAYTRPFYETLRSLWSLAVEEHFYMLWPIAVRYLNRRQLIFVLVGLLLFESLLRASVSFHHLAYSAIYYTTPFRLDGLALGALLAVLFEVDAVREKIAAFSAPAAIGIATLYIFVRLAFGLRFTTAANSSMLFNVGTYPMVALASAALLAYLLTHKRSLLSKVLASKALVFIGSISYGMYLYQVPIEEFVTRTLHLTNRPALAVDLPLTIFVAWVSFRFYERPLVVWGKRQAEKQHRQGLATSRV